MDLETLAPPAGNLGKQLNARDGLRHSFWHLGPTARFGYRFIIGAWKDCA